MSKEIKRMTVKEFRDVGFLQEANRQFFHPLGLALEVIVKCKKSPNTADSGEMLIGGIWDYRNDSEGIIFGENTIDKEKIETIDRLRRQKQQVRSKLKCCGENGIQIK